MEHKADCPRYNHNPGAECTCSHATRLPDWLPMESAPMTGQTIRAAPRGRPMRKVSWDGQRFVDENGVPMKNPSQWRPVDED